MYIVYPALLADIEIGSKIEIDVAW